MSTEDTSTTAAAGPVLSEGLGPLPECYVTSGGRDLWSEEQMLAYAAQERAVERERWCGLVQAALDADEGDHVLGKSLADRMRAALRA